MDQQSVSHVPGTVSGHASLESMLALFHADDSEAPALLEDWAAAVVSRVSDANADGGDTADCVLAGTMREQQLSLQQLCQTLAATSSSACARALALTLARLSTAGVLKRVLPGTDSVSLGCNAQADSLAAALIEACESVLFKYCEFLDSASKLPAAFMPRYALPLDLALAAAHCCDVVLRFEARPPASSQQKTERLAASLLFASENPYQTASGGADVVSFVRVAQVVSSRSALARRHISSIVDFTSIASSSPDAQVMSARSAVRSLDAGDWVTRRSQSSRANVDDEPMRVLLVEGLAAFIAPLWGGGGCLLCPVGLLHDATPQLHCGPGQYGGLSETASSALTSHLEVLGLPPTSINRPQDITRAYRRLARQHHPDKGGQQEEFVRIRSAFEALCLGKRPAATFGPAPASSSMTSASVASSPQPKRGASAGKSPPLKGTVPASPAAPTSPPTNLSSAAKKPASAEPDLFDMSSAAAVASSAKSAPAPSKGTSRMPKSTTPSRLAAPLSPASRGASVAKKPAAAELEVLDPTATSVHGAVAKKPATAESDLLDHARLSVHTPAARKHAAANLGVPDAASPLLHTPEKKAGRLKRGGVPVFAEAISSPMSLPLAKSIAKAASDAALARKKSTARSGPTASAGAIPMAEQTSSRSLAFVKRRPSAESGESLGLVEPPAKYPRRSRAQESSSDVATRTAKPTKAGDRAADIPAHELSVNGILQLIWSFAFHTCERE